MSTRHDEPPHMRPPTDLELKISALGIPDDVSFYVFRDDAVRTTGNGNWEQDYEDWAVETIGFVPERLHNLGPDNIWGYPPGPECCQGLPPFPPGLLQAQIELLNKCADFESVVIVGDKVKQKARQVWDQVKAVIGPPREPKEP